MADIPYLLSKVGAITSATQSKAIEIIDAAEKAGHNVRFVWGKSSSGEHGTGNALDLMVYNEADGDFIRDYIWANRARLRVRHVIWEQHITSTVVQPGVRRLMGDRGSVTQNHLDHNHVLFLDASAYVPPGTSVMPPANPVDRKTNEQVASEVWAGVWGSGADRVARLQGAGYDAAYIQSLVNQGVGKIGVSSAPNRKTNVQVASEVWAGVWGSGADRVNRLQGAGYDAAYIQDLVNKGVGKIGVSSDPNRKSTATIAQEVIAGKWGNGPDRVARLNRAGYDAVAVQHEVNRQL